MTPGQQTYALYVGIDIAAATASVALMEPHQAVDEVFTIEQTEQGITGLIAKLATTNYPVSQIRVVMEATGTYWMRLASRLFEVGFAVSVVNPAQAYYYAKAWLQRAKSDKLDAQTLAHLAYQMQPDLWVPDPVVYEELEQRLVERESLLSIQQQLRNQLHALRHRPTVVVAVEQRKQALLVSIQEQIDAIEREIKSLMGQEHQYPTVARSQLRTSRLPTVKDNHLLSQKKAFSAIRSFLLRKRSFTTPLMARSGAGSVQLFIRPSTA